MQNASSDRQTGPIHRYYQDHAPDAVRAAIKDGGGKTVLSDSYPHKKPIKRAEYEARLHLMQIELVKMQAWCRATNQRVAMIFEGRDAAGKGGSIKRFTEHLNPRGARVVALAKPSDAERTQWYFQRYINHLPSGGNLSLYDRSWYNRGVVEHVFGFCTPTERETFFRQVLPLEQALVHDGLHLVKFWLNVGRAEQLRRFMERETDPLKHWKLSPIDIDGLAQWDAYSDAIRETLARTHSDIAPWTVIRSDDKKRARLAAIRHLLSQLDYDGKNEDALGDPFDLICGGPEILDA
ncbi:MAG: polyphosphate kinase 2 [Marinibacterium sp.]|nr:polyphosphate kinase 2 [Marinibacterium sp.]